MLSTLESIEESFRPQFRPRNLVVASVTGSKYSWLITGWGTFYCYCPHRASVVENEVYGSSISLLYVASSCPLGRPILWLDLSACSLKHNHTGRCVCLHCEWLGSIRAQYCSNLMTDESDEQPLQFSSIRNRTVCISFSIVSFQRLSTGLVVGCYILKRHWFQIYITLLCTAAVCLCMHDWWVLAVKIYMQW